MIELLQTLIQIFLISAVKESNALGVDILQPISALHGLTRISEYWETLNFPVFDDVPNADFHKQQYDLGLNNEEKYMNFTQLATKYGRNVSTHEVQTEDGYILTMFRLFATGEPVILMHSLFSSSDDWITSGPKSSIAYLLNDKNYDVWLPNVRGAKYSRRHVSLSPDADAARFWNFSFHEIGRDDYPVIIDYVLATTNRPKLKFVGHAQGATAFYVLCSERPEYNQKISVQVGLSTLAWMSHAKAPFIRLLTAGSPVIDIITKLIGQFQFVPDNALTSMLRDALCGNVALASTVCANIIFLVAGIDYGQLNFTNLPVIYNHVPASCSTKQVLHYTQLVSSGRFQNFDYGVKNALMYNGSSIPPEYAVEKITAPVAIFWGDGDWLATYPDLVILRDHLSNVVDFFKIEFPNFNHLDFLWGFDLKTLIVPRLLSLFGKY